MCDAFTTRFLDGQSRMARRLNLDFPRASAQDVEDALAEAYADLLPRSGWAPIHDSLIYLAAWRQLRGVFRRHAHRYERSIEDLDSVQSAAVAPGQEVVLNAAQWLTVFEGVVSAHGRPHSDALRRALLDKMETGDTDVTVSARHGIRRERLNRAWRAFLDALLPG